MCHVGPGNFVGRQCVSAGYAHTNGRSVPTPEQSSRYTLPMEMITKTRVPAQPCFTGCFTGCLAEVDAGAMSRVTMSI